MSRNRDRDIEAAAEKYKTEGGEWFSLKDDKDTAVVRILQEGEKLVFDEDWFIVHEVEIEKVKKKVRCPEDANCPLCKNGNKPQLKIFLQLVDKKDGKRKLWERGNTFVGKINGLINRYGDLCNRPYEIERQGKAGDSKTKYEFYPLDRDDKQLSDIPVERQVLLGNLILELTEDEMWDVVDGKYKLPDRNSGNNNSGSSRDRNRDNGRDRDSDRGRDRRDEDRSAPSDRDAPPDRGSRDRNEDRSERRDSGERRREKSGSDVF